MNSLSHSLRFTFSVIYITASVHAQEESSKADLVERLKFMKESTHVYEITAGTDGRIVTVQPEAALRWTNPITGLKDGTLFFWLSKEGRPYAAAQVFLIDSGIWLHEFQSMTTDPLQVTRKNHAVWGPTKKGVEWKAIPDAPEPANSAPLRLSQMKAIAERFGANDDFEGKSRWELRLLAKPLLRYSNNQENIIDGATFAFVVTTDPEVFVMVEAIRTGGTESWQYALAPMTAYALKVSMDGQVVWEKPWTKEPIPKESPYQILVYKPEPQ